MTKTTTTTKCMPTDLQVMTQLVRNSCGSEECHEQFKRLFPGLSGKQVARLILGRATVTGYGGQCHKCECASLPGPAYTENPAHFDDRTTVVENPEFFEGPKSYRCKTCGEEYPEECPRECTTCGSDIMVCST